MRAQSRKEREEKREEGIKFRASGFCAGSEQFEHPRLDFEGITPASADVVVATATMRDKLPENPAALKQRLRGLPHRIWKIFWVCVTNYF